METTIKNDSYYGLDAGGLGPRMYNDFNLELQKIEKEMKRFGLI